MGSEQEIELEWERVSGVKSYRLCGLMMFGLKAAMSGMVVQIVWQNHSYEYPGIMIYLFVLYAFYSHYDPALVKRLTYMTR